MDVGAFKRLWIGAGVNLEMSSDAGPSKLCIRCVSGLPVC